MAEVEIMAVSKAFKKTEAVSDLSLTVGDGEFVALLGPTGAGKTTTLRLIAGLEMPDRGSIRIGSLRYGQGSGPTRIAMRCPASCVAERRSQTPTRDRQRPMERQWPRA